MLSNQITIPETLQVVETLETGIRNKLAAEGCRSSEARIKDALSTLRVVMTGGESIVASGLNLNAEQRAMLDDIFRQTAEMFDSYIKLYHRYNSDRAQGLTHMEALEILRYSLAKSSDVRLDLQ